VQVRASERPVGGLLDGTDTSSSTTGRAIIQKYSWLQTRARTSSPSIPVALCAGTRGDLEGSTCQLRAAFTVDIDLIRRTILQFKLYLRRENIFPSAPPLAKPGH